MPVEIIAEIGINHNGNVCTAETLIKNCSLSGADTVKFQLYDTNQIMSEEHELYEVCKDCELSHSEYDHLVKMARKLELNVLASPFDVPSVMELIDLGIPRIKIPSGEITNPFLLDAINGTRMPVVMSTGMATKSEICWALNRLGNCKVTLMHCTSCYPANHSDLNLNCIKTLGSAFNLDVGYSDHTLGWEASIAAVAMGATVIEKHLTLDCSMDGPDHKASLQPEEFYQMTQEIRRIESALGSYAKIPATTEYEIKYIARKSLVAVEDLKAGTVLRRACLTAKRPLDGIPAERLEAVIGRTCICDIKAGEPLLWERIV